jgi:hypothetical protein
MRLTPALGKVEIPSTSRSSGKSTQHCSFQLTILAWLCLHLTTELLSISSSSLTNYKTSRLSLIKRQLLLRSIPASTMTEEQLSRFREQMPGEDEMPLM